MCLWISDTFFGVLTLELRSDSQLIAQKGYNNKKYVAVGDNKDKTDK